MNVLQQFRLDGRVAFVTGAGRGIGLAIAQAFAEAGAAVAIQDIDRDVAEAEVKKLTDGGAKAIALGGDASKLAELEAWVPEVEKTLGPVDILVNNASIQSHHDFLDWPTQDVDDILRTNVTGPFRLCQQVIPHMRQQQWGRILNLGSIQGLRGYLSMSPYSASKAALHNLTNSLARGYGEFGITCNAIAPGYFNTYRNRSQFTDPNKPPPRFPIRRVGLPEDCAGAALLLCSNAGSYITGVVLSVDGGMAITG